MKKNLLTVLLVLLPACLMADNKWFVDLGAGGGNARMSSYNTDISGLQQTYAGFDTQLNGLDYDSFISASAGYFAVPGFGIYLRAEKIFMGDSSSRITVDGNPFYKRDVRFDAVYFGLGIKKYAQDYIPTLSFVPYAAIDAGIVASTGDRFSYAYYNLPGNTGGSPEGSIVEQAGADIKGSMFGACAEAGVEYYLTQWFGFSGKAGYRYASGELSGKSSGIVNGVQQYSLEIKQQVEYSGVYIGIGTVFLF
jgi:hypothetical protein